MKWLILLALVACGKHEEPKALDYRDNDGDQVLNYQESELDKHVANFEPIGSVSGTFSFLMNDKVDIKFSNEGITGETILKLMVTNEIRISKTEYFSEMSDLNLEKTDKKFEFKLNTYPVQILFEKDSDRADEVVLKYDKSEIILGKWNSLVKAEFSQDMIKKVLSGEAQISLRKKIQRGKLFNQEKEETIRDKTYRVHYFDGTRARILYISKGLSVEELLKLQKISAVQIESEEDFFFNSHSLGHVGWFLRELENGDKILVKSDTKSFRKLFRKNYDYKKFTLSRVNGTPDGPMKLTRKSSAKVFLKIRPLVQTTRTFVESKEKKRHGSGGGGGRDGNGSDWYDCTHFLRSIRDEKVGRPNFDSLLENVTDPISLSVGNEVQDEKGIFWEIKFASDEIPELALKARPDATYTITGEYKNSCSPEMINRGRHASYKTNSEGKLSFEVETFVEKIP